MIYYETTTTVTTTTTTAGPRLRCWSRPSHRDSCVLLLRLLLHNAGTSGFESTSHATDGTPVVCPLVSMMFRVFRVLLLHSPGTLVVPPRFSARLPQNKYITHLPVSSPPTADMRVGNQSVTCIMWSYDVPHSDSGRWLFDQIKPGTCGQGCR